MLQANILSELMPLSLLKVDIPLSQSLSFTDFFSGFIIQGRRSDEEALGVFQPPKGTDQYQLLNCFKVNGNTITHQNNLDKNEIMAEWVVDPLNFEGGFLYGVVVYNYTTVQKLAFDL